MNLLYIVLAALLVVAVLTFVGPWVNQKIAEPFQGSICPVLPPSQADVLPPSPDPVTFQQYIDAGRRENNKTAGMLTGEQMDRLPTNFNEQLRQALTTSMVQPTVPERPYTDSRPVELVYGPSGAQGILANFAAVVGYRMGEVRGPSVGPDMSQPWTFFGRKPSYVEESVPDTLSTFAEDVKKCEKFNAFTTIADGTKKNRKQLCDALKDGSLDATCGVCLKSGTTYTKESGASGIGLSGTLVNKLTNYFIGGMFLSARDRDRQRAATAVGRATAYRPTAGTCAEGYFFVSGQEDACLKAARQLACEEYGDKGGFDATGAVTADELTPTQLLGQCVACQQDTKKYLVSSGGGQPLRVRIVTPVGTGITAVYYRQGVSGEFTRQLIPAGSATFLQFPNIKPNDTLDFEVYQEFPHRPRGQEEVFFAVVTSTSDKGTSFAEAETYCRNLDATVATVDQLQEAYNAGAQVCPAGYAADGKGYTVHQYDDYVTCSSGGRGVRTVSGDISGVWCYGIRPAKNFYSLGSRNNQTLFNPNILNWFEYIRRTSELLLNEEEKESTYSRYGNITDGANYRGILIQLESGTDVRELQQRRRDSAERYITKVGEIDISNKNLTTKLTDYYSRNGQFSNSLRIVEPRPSQMSDIPLLANQYWLWGIDHTSKEFKVQIQVPGYFRDPEYPEDLAKCPTGILFTDGVNRDRGTPSACEDGPTDACLRELFEKAGGDKAAGELGPDNVTNGTTNRKVLRYKDYVLPSGAFSTLPESSLTERTVDEIETFLKPITENASGINLPPKNAGENPTDYNKRILEVMQRAQRNLRGSSDGGPCDVLVKSGDTYSIQPKTTLNIDTTGPIDSKNIDVQCLQSLYNDKRTYTTLDKAYSGISDTEIAASFVRNAFPFQACQPTGTWAPIKADGSVDPAVIASIKSAALAFPSAGSPSAGFLVDNVKGVFNQIHADANSSNTNPVRQSEAMGRCYGIVKKELPSNCLGIQTKKIRILPSAYRYNTAATTSCGGAPAAIRFKEGGITVKDSAGNCVGTPTFTVEYNQFEPSRAPRFEGGVYVDKTSSGAYNVKQSKVNLEFTGAQNVQAIDYVVPTGDCSSSVIGMVFQILDDATPPKVMVQKVLPTITDISNANLTFNVDDMVPTIPYASIATGLEFRLETAIYPDMYFRKPADVAGSLVMRLTPDSVFVIKEDINGSTRDRVCSILHKPSATYLSYNPTTQSLIYVPKDIANITQRSWASWAVQPALNGSPAHIVLESANYPGQFLMPAQYSTTQGVVSVETLDFTSDFDKFRACWALRPAD